MVKSSSSRTVFVTGASGYMGQRLCAELLRRGHAVRALVRAGSEKKLPPGCATVLGNALDASSYASAISPSDTFVQLVGVAHPSPRKAAEFRSIDLSSAKGAIGAASQAGVNHFVYVSVAQPAPLMKDYIAVRAECEHTLRESGLNATILRPWYVLGPGHWWPYLLIPMYWAMELIPSTRASARRLGLVTIQQMVTALADAVDHPADGVHILEVPDIRSAEALRKK